MSKSLIHIHTYVRWKKQFGELHFKCSHPDCTHTMRASLLLGKRSMCAICGIKELILPDTLSELIRRVKPRCKDCSNTRESRQRRELEEIVGTVLLGDEIRG